jgi:hypothetical protein
MWQELLKLNIFIEKAYLKSRRDLLGGVIFKVLGAMFGGARATGWVDVFGFRRCASAAGLLPTACPPHEA